MSKSQSTPMPMRRVRLVWSMPDQPGRHQQAFEIPATARHIQCLADIPIEGSTSEFIQVLLPGTSTPYIFRCPGATLDERVAVPMPGRAPLITTVIGLGCGSYRGPVTKTATRVDA